MNRNEAINIIQQVCQNFRGTWQDHCRIQEALKILLTPIKTDNACEKPIQGIGPNNN